MALPVLPAIMGMLRAGLVSALRIGSAVAGRSGSLGAGLRQGAMQRAAPAATGSARQYAIQRGSTVVGGSARSVGSGSGSSAASSAAPGNLRQEVMRSAANRVYRAAADRIRHITHSQVVNTNNNQQYNNTTDNSVNNSYNQSGDSGPGQSSIPPFDLPTNNSQARVGEESPRLFMAMGIAATAATLGLGGISLASISVANRMHRWAEGLSEQQRYLAQYNGTIAYSFAELEARRIGRNIQRGRITGESTKYLNDQLNRLEEKLLPYQAFSTTAINVFAGSVLQALTSMLDKMESLGGSIKSVLPQTWIVAVDLLLAHFNQNAQSAWSQSATKQAIDIANQQLKRRANPPGGF